MYSLDIITLLIYCIFSAGITSVIRFIGTFHWPHFSAFGKVQLRWQSSQACCSNWVSSVRYEHGYNVTIPSPTSSVWSLSRCNCLFLLRYDFLVDSTEKLFFRFNFHGNWTLWRVHGHCPAHAIKTRIVQEAEIALKKLLCALPNQ